MRQAVSVEWEHGLRDGAEIELTVEAEAAIEGQSPFSLPQLVRSFATLADFGAFSKKEMSRELSHDAFSSAQVTRFAAQWILAHSGDDIGATAVLRNLIRFSARRVAPLRWARIRSMLSPQQGAHETMPLIRLRPMSFDWEVSLDSDVASVCIDFGSPPDNATATAVDELLISWLHVAAAGGMSPDVAEVPRPMVIAYDGPVWVGGEAWLSLSNVDLEETAFVPLLNALHTVHMKVAPILRFEVG